MQLEISQNGMFWTHRRVFNAFSLIIMSLIFASSSSAQIFDDLVHEYYLLIL